MIMIMMKRDDVTSRVIIIIVIGYANEKQSEDKLPFPLPSL